MNSFKWFFKNLSWYLVLLTGCLGVSVVIASVNVKAIADATDSILHTLGIKEHSISKLMTGVDWSLTISWAVVGVVLAGVHRARLAAAGLRSACSWYRTCCDMFRIWYGIAVEGVPFASTAPGYPGQWWVTLQLPALAPPSIPRGIRVCL
jgi:hypothetical protein